MISVDLFAGGGGASLAIKQATGAEPLIAVNHDAHAIRMHAANHPGSIHLQQDVWLVDPYAVLRAQPVVDILWASPDCTHHSRAKGGKPRSRKLRHLADVVPDWAWAIRPRMILLENVPEFEQWGPLYPDDHPDPKLRSRPIKARAGEDFRAFVERLEVMGYVVEWRVLNAADFGAPTSRRRLFLVARADGVAPAWPAPTHGPGRARPWRSAAECIDWSIPCPSIFERRRPLAEATQRRIAEGVRRYVLGSARPFLVNLSHGGRLAALESPLATLTADPVGGDRLLVAPMLSPVKSWGGGGNEARPVDQPMRTTTTSKRGEHAVVSCMLQLQQGSVGRPAEAQLGTATAVNHHALLAASLVQLGYGERDGQAPHVLDLERPLGTVVSGGGKAGLIAAFLARNNGTTVGKENPGRDLERPAGTITETDTHGLAAVFLDKLHGSARAGVPVDEPCPTVAAGGGRGGGHAALVAAFLIKYYGTGGQWAKLADSEPMHTIVAKARMGLVTVEIDGEEWAIVDIGMRMLTPRELARAQGFPEDYVLTGTKSQQIARIGNSVSPPPARALIEAQLRAGPPRPPSWSPPWPPPMPARAAGDEQAGDDCEEAV